MCCPADIAIQGTIPAGTSTLDKRWIDVEHQRWKSSQFMVENEICPQRWNKVEIMLNINVEIRLKMRMVVNVEVTVETSPLKYGWNEVEKGLLNVDPTFNINIYLTKTQPFLTISQPFFFI